MTHIAKENLDERIERITKRNVEIEKKHREAEKDRLMALKKNAMVETKPPKDTDWPKGHKYDTVDYLYDVKPEKLQEFQQNIEIIDKNINNYKKFTDGNGPPPDPSYNFLADAKRDGTFLIKKNTKNDKREIKIDKNIYRDNKKTNEQQTQKRGNKNNYRGNNGKNQYAFKSEKDKNKPDYDQWRREREKIDIARINRQKLDGDKWKREWDNEKTRADNVIPLDQPQNISERILNSASSRSIINYNNKGIINITKQVNLPEANNSQIGEVKSVKLTTVRTFGSGRVGPRQLSKTQFSVQTVEEKNPITKNITSMASDIESQVVLNYTEKSLEERKIQNVNDDTINQHSKQINCIEYFSTPHDVQNKFASLEKSDRPLLEAQLFNLQTDANVALIAADLSRKPEFAITSVQERLKRAQQAKNANIINKTDSHSAGTNFILDNKTTTNTKDHKLKSGPNNELNCDNNNESIQRNHETITACN